MYIEYATQSSGIVFGNRLKPSPNALKSPSDLSILAESKSSVFLFATNSIVPRDMISRSVKPSGKFADLVYFPTIAL